ncbi:tudor domain-containing protein 15 [Epinephelus fuscoguttatus]|uniref:tudor domain-containing protein 15 n=1 Tax=Epinephelus fuscoguttatus TaxID=293821 RepID=UPI0020D19F13|nr:tudor domain-containing protein 15 [Epinephelus fuscoguttatus]
MQSVLGSEHQKSGPSAPCALWAVDLKLTHLDWNPEATLIHFQGQYQTICELDYNILQGEIQNVPKTKAAVDIGEFCLVEDLTSGRWYRGRVQNQKEDLFDVFLIDHGNVLSVDIAHISSCSNNLFILPPKIVCGFLANVLLLQGSSHSVVEVYLSTLIGSNVTGYIQALLPHNVLLLEALDINNDLVKHGFGRHVDTDTFILLVGMLTEVPLKQNREPEPAPDLLIVKPRGQEFCLRPCGLQRYEDILSFCGPRLSCGTRAKVRVTAAVSAGLFYCQMTSMETELREMSKKLAAVNEYRAKEHNPKTPENVGLLCSVKGKDGKWYRGFVQYLPVNSQLRVLFIDYGFFESVKVENVHSLPPYLYSTPIMAFPCSLSSLSDQAEEVKTQQLSFLKAGLLGRVLDVEILSFDEEKYLYSMTVIGADDNHVNELEPIQELARMKVKSVFETEELSPQCDCLYYETIMGKALDQTLEAGEVAVDSIFVGYVEHVQNPNNFWIRTQKRNDEFEEMMTEMANNFSQVKLDEEVLLNPEPGTLCCAVYEKDMHFYRGVVTDTLEHGAEVLFIDFGNIEKVPHMLIKKIPEKFSSKSAFAFCCTLVNVLPEDEVWTSATSDFFRQVVSDKALLVHVVQMRKNKFVVDLHEMGSDNNQSITELLISCKQAAYWNNIPTEPMVQNNTDVTDETKYPRYGMTSDINGNTEQLEDWEKSEKTYKNLTEKSEAPDSFKALAIKPGCDFAVCCSYIESPSNFWCQPLVKVPALDKLMDEIQRYYSTHTVPLQLEDTCCVARSPLDGKWYRAFITEKQNGHAKVMLVDYGFNLSIREHNLMTIMTEYLHLEVQAFRCSLYNLIEPSDTKNRGDWSPELCKLLKDFALNCTSGLRCTVVSQLSVKNKGLCNVVELYNTQTQQSITKLLLEQDPSSKVTNSTKQLSTVYPESFVYSSFDLSPGNEEQVYITHVSSQWEVYCHLDRNTETIEELGNKISKESKKMMQASTRAVVRKLCLAKYFDGKWYRGLAHPVQSSLHLSVFFVDYGNTIISEKTHVMFIPRDSADLLYTPMQAVRCNLASVSKEVLYADVKEWLDGATLNKQVRAVIVGKNEDGSFNVELFDGDVNINEKVKELIVGLLPKPKTVVSFEMSSTKTKNKTHTANAKTCVKSRSHCKGQSPNSPKWKAQRRTQVGSAPNKEKENTKNCVQKALNKKTQVKQQNEDSTKRSGPIKPQKTSERKPQKTSEIKQERRYLETNTKSEKPVDTVIPQLSDMKVSAGFRAKCFVSHIDSVNSFFLQLSEDEPAILKMGEDLNSSISRDSLTTNTSLRISDLVVAEYEEDGALYRSVVKDFEGSSGFKVEFVDYGNSAVIGKEKIYSIPKEYLSQPRFSISCSLLDTSKYKNDASFTDAVMEKPLMVDFVCQRGSHWEVKLEILDGAVGPPAVLEAASESSSETRNEEEASVSSSETEERESDSEEGYPRKEVSENETAKYETMTPTVDDEKLIQKTSPATLSPKLEAHKAPTTNMDDSENERETSESKSDCSDEVIPQIIQAKDTEYGTLLSVLSNGSFYTRLKKTSELLASLESHITDSLYKCEMVPEEDLKQDLKCLVQVQKDKKWHRAVLQHVGPGKCQVLLVDHGRKEEIPSDLIRKQCNELTKTPHLAVLCKVNSLGLSKGEVAHKLWYETLEPMIGEELKLVFECYSEADNLWMVEIVISGLFLIRQITASLQQTEETITSIAETQTKKAEGQCDLDLSPPQQLVFAPVGIDKAYSGFAASASTPFEFSVVLEDLLLIMNKVSIMLEDLPGQMPSLPEAHLIPGTCCLLKSGTKNKWCRAEIIHVNNTVVLNLVDYGHHECIPYKDCSKLKRISEEMTNIPKVTYPCVLRGVKPVRADGQWTDEAAGFFQQCLYLKDLQIFFREFVSNTHWMVDILTEGRHVAKKLVDAGHASYMDIMLGLRFQEQSPCKALPRSPDSEKKCAQEDEGSDGKSDLSFESADEAEEKMPLSAVSGTRQCFLM